MQEKLILVDKKDKKVGVEEKLKVHREGKLHRAFSVFIFRAKRGKPFIFNSKRETLIQQRAESKYHSGGLWGNTCCSHPKPGELLNKSAEKRLEEEMGIKTELKEVFNFIYKAKVGDLTEHEFDHIFIGKFDGQPKPRKSEVQNFKWVKLKNLESDIKKNPQKYTPWLKIGLKKLKKITKLRINFI